MTTKAPAKKAPKAEEATIETPQGTRPSDLATAMGVSAKALRARLRKMYPRQATEKNTSWYLTTEQVEEVTAAFAAKPESDEDEA